MRFCDLTLSYGETSGGIRTYLDQKRRYLLEHTEHEHVLIVPAEESSVERGERWTTVRIASPAAPGYEMYRFFWRPDKIRRALMEHRPDVVELANFYVSPLAAFSYRRAMAEEGARPIVGGFFHTDIAGAYFNEKVRGMVGEALGGWTDGLAGALGNVLETGAEQYFGRVFERCDVVLAPTPNMAARLRDYGVERAHVVPLGVDLERFHPRRRSAEQRARFGAADGEPVLLYGGRIDKEKHVRLLFDAFDRLPDPLGARLVLLGEGPLREAMAERAERTPRAHVLPYETDPDVFADLMASADVYVTAGPHETFALSVIEAQASGLPVVGVSAGALVERVPDELGCLAPVDDAAAFAAGIERAWAERDAMGAAARRHVEERFGWGASLGTLVGLYESAPVRPSEVPAEA